MKEENKIHKEEINLLKEESNLLKDKYVQLEERYQSLEFKWSDYIPEFELPTELVTDLMGIGIGAFGVWFYQHNVDH